MSYFTIFKDPRVQGQPSILSCPPDVNPEIYLQGRVLPEPETPIKLKMSDRSGDFRGCVIDGIVTLFHDVFRDQMQNAGIDNIQYFPVDLENPNGEIEKQYSLINIIGLLEAVDISRSTITPSPSAGRGTLKSFEIDLQKAAGLQLFRIVEDPTLIIISEEIRTALMNGNLAGTVIMPTSAYDGWGY